MTAGTENATETVRVTYRGHLMDDATFEVLARDAAAHIHRHGAGSLGDKLPRMNGVTWLFRRWHRKYLGHGRYSEAFVGVSYQDAAGTTWARFDLPSKRPQLCCEHGWFMTSYCAECGRYPPDGNT